MKNTTDRPSRRPTNEQLSKMIVYAREEGCVCELEAALIELSALRQALPMYLGDALEALSRAYDALENEGVINPFTENGLGDKICNAANGLRRVQSSLSAQPTTEREGR